MNPGAYRDRVTIERATVTRTGNGVTKVWTADGVRWGRVSEVDLSGRAKYAQAGYSEVSHNILFRRPIDLNLAATRFRWRGLVLEPIAPASNPQGIMRLATIPTKTVPGA